MAKIKLDVSYKGIFDFETMTLTEENKYGIQEYSILDMLRSFDGKDMSITFKEENPVTPKIKE